jgi:hypothetical protein
MLQSLCGANLLATRGLDGAHSSHELRVGRAIQWFAGILAVALAAYLTTGAAFAGLTLNSVGLADGLQISTFVTGFPTFSSCGGCGANGSASTSDGKILVGDGAGNIYLFNDIDG